MRNVTSSLVVALVTALAACDDVAFSTDLDTTEVAATDVVDESRQDVGVDSDDSADTADSADALDASAADAAAEVLEADAASDTVELPPLPDLLDPPDYCGGLPPDDPCYVSRRDPLSANVALARRLGDAVVGGEPASSYAWQWAEAVLMIGMAELGRVSGDPRYTEFVKAWLDYHIADGYSIETSDTCAPAALAIAMMRAGHADAHYPDVVDDALTYLYEESLRTAEGGLNHLGTIDVFGVQLWADSLFMFGNVLTGWGEWDGNVRALDEYASQYGIFAALMQGEAGFFKHAVYSPFEQDNDVYWARANGWILAAGFDHLRVRRARGERVENVERSARSLAAAVVASQDDATGLWFTVVNRPGETYLETSASALFAYGLARGWRYGLLDDSVLPTVRAAIAGLRTRIVDDPESGDAVVVGTSGPTNVGTFDYYASVAVSDNIPYGIGASILALIESSGLPEGSGDF